MTGEQEGECFSGETEKLNQHELGTLPMVGNNGRFDRKHFGTPTAVELKGEKRQFQ